MKIRNSLLLAAFGILIASTCFAQSLPHTWSYSFGTTGTQSVRSVVVDSDDNIIIAGEFSGTIDFGGGPLGSLGDRDIFLAKFDGDGTHIWSKRFGSTQNQHGANVDVLSNGMILLVGYYQNQVNFGAGTHFSAGGYDAFVAKFWPNGNIFWSKSFGDDNEDYCTDVAQANGGMTYMVGYFNGSIDLGGGALTSAGGYDIWHAELDGSGGNHLWSNRYGNSQDQIAYAIGGHVQGNNAITGFTFGSLDLGGGALPSGGSRDAFVAMYRAWGAHVWSKQFGDASSQYGMDVAIEISAQDVYLAGQFLGSINLGGGLLTSVGNVDIFLARFTDTGSHLWSKRFGGTLNDYPRRVDAHLFHGVVLTGFFEGTASFGGDPLVSAGDDDVFLATYERDGTHVTSQRAGDTTGDIGLGVDFTPDGHVVAAGNSEGNINWGGGPLPNGGGWDPYIVKFSSLSDAPSVGAEGHVLRLRANPNPVVRTTIIPYTLARAGNVRLELYDLQGRLVETLIDGFEAAGAHEVTWAPREGASSPILFARLTTETEVRVVKLVVLD